MKKLIIIAVAVGSALFFTPWVCMLAWNNWAWEFNLPQLGYWHWFLTTLAIHGLFGARKISTEEE